MNEQDVVISLDLEDLWKDKPRAARLVLHTLGGSVECVLTEELAQHLCGALLEFLQAGQSS